MMFIKRLLANFIDLFVFFGLLVLFFLFALPVILSVLGMEEANLVIAGASFVIILAGVFLLQYPFMINNQTIGKALFGLRIISTEADRPLTVGIIIQREVFAKFFTCYIMCASMLFGSKEGQHDKVCGTKVV